MYNNLIKSINFITGLSKKTIGRIAKQNIKENTQIGGPGVVVEIDGSKFGKQKYHKAHRVDGVWVLERLNVLFAKNLY